MRAYVLRVVVPSAALLACVWQTPRQVAIWRDDTALWGHAAALAPRKPRPVLNYGVALMATGQPLRGLRSIIRADTLSRQRHVLPWDRAVTQAAVMKNLGRLGLRR